MNTATMVSNVTNGAQKAVLSEMPYVANITIEGSSDLLFHAWNCEAIEEKSKAKKGSAEKKTDNIETYVYRNDDGEICLPTEYLRMSVVNAAKFRQDPRSPRKSAMDLFKAAIISLNPLSPLTSVTGEVPRIWDYEHKCRVQVQRSGITRVRPAFRKGWVAEVSIMVNLPEYIDPSDLNSVVSSAGRLIGVGDFRPTYGRFQVIKFEVQN